MVSCFLGFDTGQDTNRHSYQICGWRQEMREYMLIACIFRISAQLLFCSGVSRTRIWIEKTWIFYTPISLKEWNEIAFPPYWCRDQDIWDCIGSMLLPGQDVSLACDHGKAACMGWPWSKDSGSRAYRKNATRLTFKTRTDPLVSINCTADLGPRRAIINKNWLAVYWWVLFE